MMRDKDGLEIKRGTLNGISVYVDFVRLSV